MALIEGAFIELGIALAIALIVLVIIRYFKMPFILGYIVAGIITGPLILNLFNSEKAFTPLVTIGVSLLLFVVGLNLNPQVIKNVKKVALLTGLGQLFFTLISGFIIARLLYFDVISSIYIALALSLSSTIIIMKFLSDKSETDTLHGRILIGFLLIQDFVHILALVILKMIGTIQKGTLISTAIIETLLKGATVTVALVIVAVYVFPSITRKIAKSQELLLIFSISWAFGVALIFEMLNFTAEVGALVAGISLSMSPYKYEISSKMKPFRDFFLLIFFIWLGSQLEPISLQNYISPIIIFSLLVLIASPLVVMFIMGALGYTKRNSFLTAISIAQISEFSFIIVAVGVIEGFIQKEILTMTIAIGLVTIAGSSLVLEHSKKIYHKLSPFLKIFEKSGKKIDDGVSIAEKEYEIILFGHNRIGFGLRESFKKITNNFLVIDNNPEIIQNLTNEGVDCRYGDAEDLELLSILPIKKAKIIISTIPDFETNMTLIERIHQVNKDAIIIAVSHQIEETMQLYGAGATYVITPHFLGGTHASYLIEKYKFDKRKFNEEAKKSINELLQRKERGHRDVIHHRG